jgi:anti-sigma factor RsiW
MMCAGNEERIARYVGGDLAPEEAAALERHLRDCAVCADLASAMEQDAELLASRPPELAEVDFAAMRREIRREIARPNWSWKWVAAAAAALVLIGGLTTIRRPRQPAPPAVTASVPPAPPLPAKVAALVPKRTRRAKRVDHLPPQAVSPVTIRIATRDPNVTIILLHESKGALE